MQRRRVAAFLGALISAAWFMGLYSLAGLLHLRIMGSPTPSASRALRATLTRADFCDLLPSCVDGDCASEQHCLSGVCGSTAADGAAADGAASPPRAPPAVVSWPFALRMRSPVETVKRLRLLVACQRPVLFLRFGDGDVVLSRGEPDMMQTPAPGLADSIMFAFSLRGFNVLKTLPLHSMRFGQWPGMNEHAHAWEDEVATAIAAPVLAQFYGEPVYSTVALHHTIVHNRALALALIADLKALCPIFVGNEAVPLAVRDALFGQGHVFIPTPPRDAWGAEQRVRDALVPLLQRNAQLTQRPYRAVVFGMGCSGRAVAARVWADTAPNAVFFDFGSLLDWLSGNSTRAWIEKQREVLDVSALLADTGALPAGCRREV
jgi:hypothetical protein